MPTNRVRTCSLLISYLLFTSSLQAFALPFTLDFEGIGNEALIQEFYNGGTDSEGNSGTNYGVSFGANDLGLIDRDADGTGNFANEPTPDTIMFFLSNTAILNYSLGFDNGFSFLYTTSQNASVTVWDNIDATGSLLGEINLTANNLANNCVGDPQGGPGDSLGQFCHFDVGALAFSGTARSIDFSGTVNQVGFDNVTFGSVDPYFSISPSLPPTSVSEPANIATFALGLFAIVFSHRKRKMLNNLQASTCKLQS